MVRELASPSGDDGGNQLDDHHVQSIAFGATSEVLGGQSGFDAGRPHPISSDVVGSRGGREQAPSNGAASAGFNFLQVSELAGPSDRSPSHVNSNGMTVSDGPGFPSQPISFGDPDGPGPPAHRQTSDWAAPAEQWQNHSADWRQPLESTQHTSDIFGSHEQVGNWAADVEAADVEAMPSANLGSSVELESRHADGFHAVQNNRGQSSGRPRGRGRGSGYRGARGADNWRSRPTGDQVVSDHQLYSRRGHDGGRGHDGHRGHDNYRGGQEGRRGRGWLYKLLSSLSVALTWLRRQLVSQWWIRNKSLNRLKMGDRYGCWVSLKIMSTEIYDSDHCVNDRNWLLSKAKSLYLHFIARPHTAHLMAHRLQCLTSVVMSAKTWVNRHSALGLSRHQSSSAQGMIRRAAVVGSGQMGLGIAYVAAAKAKVDCKTV